MRGESGVSRSRSNGPTEAPFWNSCRRWWDCLSNNGHCRPLATSTRTAKRQRLQEPKQPYDNLQLRRPLRRRRRHCLRFMAKKKRSRHIIGHVPRRKVIAPCSLVCHCVRAGCGVTCNAPAHGNFMHDRKPRSGPAFDHPAGASGSQLSLRSGLDLRVSVAPSAS